MELKYLQTLKAITEAGSFAAAAKRLNYTQSTVTFHIQQLEQAMHVALFEKIGRRMVLTQAGHALMPYVARSCRSTANSGRTAMPSPLRTH